MSAFFVLVDSIFPAQCKCCECPCLSTVSRLQAIIQGQTDYSHWEAAVPSETNRMLVCTKLRAKRTMREYEGGSDAAGS